MTGAGGGIGEAIARALAAAGADVAIHDRELSPALSAGVVEIEQFGRRAVAVAGDVATTTEWRRLSLKRSMRSGG